MTNDLNKDLKKITEEQEIIFNSIPAWIFYKDRENRFIQVNKAFCEAMGKTKDDFEGKSLFDIFPKEIAEAYWKDDKEVIASGKPKTGIVETVETSKGQRWVQTDKIPYHDEQGSIIGVIGFSIEITERKVAEETIEKSQLMLQGIIDLLPIRIFWKDKNLNLLGCNKAFALDAGAESPNEILGKSDFEMAWKDQAELYRADDMTVINSGKPKLNYEEEQTTPKGNKIWLMTNKTPLKNGVGEIQGVLGTYMDITEQKQSDDKLKSALDETKKMNGLMIDRELKMVELKKKIEELKNQIKTPTNN